MKLQGNDIAYAVHELVALAYDIFPNPTDTRTFLPFIDRVEKDFFQLPTYVVADAGYGSEENYIDVLENRKRTPLISFYGILA